MEEIFAWSKQHPWAAGLLTLGAIFILLWLLGFFGSSSSSGASSSGTQNLAAAYYAAEAAQTTAGTQLQMATEYYTNQTAQDQIQANAATGIAATQANMYTTLGQQNASTQTALGNDQLLASNNAANDAASEANTAAYYNYQTAQAGYNAGVLNTALTTVIPQDLSYGGGWMNFALPGIGAIQSGGTSGVNPSVLLQQGWTQAQINALMSNAYGANV